MAISLKTNDQRLSDLEVKVADITGVFAIASEVLGILVEDLSNRALDSAPGDKSRALRKEVIALIEEAEREKDSRDY